MPSFAGGKTPWDPSGIGKVVVICCVVLLSVSATIVIPGNPLFHSSVSTGLRGGGVDPTTPLTKYTSPNSNLAEFNTAGSVAFNNCASAPTPFFSSAKCIKMAATVPPPPLSIQFKQATPINTLFAKITPQTLTNTYKRISWTANNTLEFDVSGGHAQTVSWLIVTTLSTTVTFYGPQPSSVTCVCTANYNGNVETLVYGPGATDTFSVAFTGGNLACLCAMAESVNPIGDLSVAAGKELEMQADWWLGSNATVTPNCNYNCSWGFFLTTNSSLWQTNSQNFNPYNDPSVALLLLVQPPVNSGSHVYGENVWLQQKPGETIQSEDTNGCSGSAYICTSGSLTRIGGDGALSWLQFNFTGSTSAAGGSGASCPTNTLNGGSSCSYTELTDDSVVPGLCGPPCSQNYQAFSTKFPNFQLPGQTYYIGFWLGSGQTGTSVYWCYDVDGCGGSYTLITNGCTSASMEIDFCVPNPTLAYSPAPTTDSGGFFGAGLRLITGTGGKVWNTVTGISNWLGNTANKLLITPAVNLVTHFITGTLPTTITAFFLIMANLVNIIGGVLGLPTLGTDLFAFFTGIGPFFGVGSVFQNAINGLANFAAGGANVFKALGSTLGTYWTDFANTLGPLGGIVAGFWTVGNLILDIGAGGGISMWFLYGALQYAEDFDKGMNWFHTTSYGLLLGWGITYYFIVLVFNHIIVPIVNILTAFNTGAELAKPDMGMVAAGA